jgi:hypothetical protein
MTSRIVKPLSLEETVTTEDDVNASKLVRIFAASLSVVTVRDPEANTDIGSFTMPAGSVTFLEKERHHTIEGTTQLKCVPVSYK